jgi:sulfonate transport system ATP-binding protein
MEKNYGYSIELNRVKKSFGPAEVLRDTTITIGRGEFVAIVGRSGSGKSTLLRLISGLDAPSGGEVLVNGKPVRSINSEVRCLFQEPRLLPWKKVLANVELGKSGNRTKPAREMLEKVGLGAKADAWPEQLSGGQKQRAALARSLIALPRILLFDEPLGALDALTRLEMQALIERIWQEERWTGILVTHDVDEAVALADKVLVIDDGKIEKEVRVSLPRPRQAHNDKIYFTRQILAAIFKDSEKELVKPAEPKGFTI